MWIMALSFSNILAAIGITIVVPLLSTASEIFGVDQGTVIWIMTGFMLTYASFMPIFGKLSDIYGRKKIFIIANVFFGFGLFLSSVSNNFLLIVIGRMFQGFGAGGILPVANALALEMMEEKKERALAIVNATYGIGMILGVNLGGILYDSFGWKSLFSIPMYLSVISLIISFIFLKEPKVIRDSNSKLDILGSVLFASVMVFFLLFIKEVSNLPLGILEIFYLMIMVISLILFVVVELKVKYPAVDIKSFKNRNYLIYNLLALTFGTTMFITVTFLAPFAQLLLNLDVKSSVYAVDPMAIVMAISILVGGVFSRKFGSKITMILGTTILLVFTFLFSHFSNDSISFYVLSMLIGLGLGFQMTPMNHIVIEEAGEKRRGESAGVVSIMRSVGGVIGPAIAGIILANTDFSSIFAYSNIIESYRKMYSLAGWFTVIAFALSILGIVVKKSKKEVEYEKV